MSRLGAAPGAGMILAAGLIALAVFFVYESRRDDPLMKVSMFRRSRTFTFSCLAALLNYGATFAISYTVSIYLQVIIGISSARAGLILITMPAVQALFSPLTGSMSDRVRPGILASIGMGICMCTLLLFSRLGEGTQMVYIIMTLCLTGFGFAMFSSPNTNAILSCVDREDYGVANSIIATMRTYGQSSGMAILSVITAAMLGSGSLETSSHADILAMMHTSFMVFAVLSVIGLFFSLARDSGK
jgi:nitrate/nitrite transporter NarK